MAAARPSGDIPPIPLSRYPPAVGPLPRLAQCLRQQQSTAARCLPRRPARRLPVAGPRALADRSPVGDPGKSPRREDQAPTRRRSRCGGGRDGPGHSAHAAACRPDLGTPQQPDHRRRGLCCRRRAIPLPTGDHRRATGTRGRYPVHRQFDPLSAQAESSCRSTWFPVGPSAGPAYDPGHIFGIEGAHRGGADAPC